jgi:thiol-disulfide isomerase/thioredoxin
MAVAAAGAAHAQGVDPDLSHSLTALPEPVPAPGFTLEDMDGEPHSLADYRGQVVLINFWATWCPPCRKEMPSLEALYQELKGEGFTVLALNQWESEELVFPFLGQLDVYPTFPILFDPESEIAEAYGVKGLPASFVVDPEGRVVYRALGGREFDHPEIMSTLRGLMGKRGRRD